MFGGFTAAPWKSEKTYSTDSTAFIFSLRRNGISYSEKYMVRDASFAILHEPSGPTFGQGTSDIFINGNGGHANFGHSYNLPSGYTYGQSNTKSYLAGSYDSWVTTEIEVFQIRI